MRSLGVPDPAEVIARSVRMYDRALAAHAEGDRIVVKYRSGSEETLL